MLKVLAVAVAGTLWAVSAPAAELAELLKPAQYDSVTISPDGAHLAAAFQDDGHGYLALLDGATFKVVNGIDAGEKGAVEGVYWVNARRFLVAASVGGDHVEESFLLPFLYASDVDGRNRKQIYAEVIDTLPDDEENVLIRRCGKPSRTGCWTYAQKMGIDGHSLGERVGDAPMPNADFVVDRRGNLKFAYGWNDEDIQQLYVRRGEDWTLLNDEAVSGIEVQPAGVVRDGQSAILWSERKDGPDVIERYDFSSGARTDLIRDAVQDPLEIVWSLDRSEPIGARYGLEAPRTRFWNPRHPDAQWIAQLEAIFPGEAVTVMNATADGQKAVALVWSDREPGRYYVLDRKTGVAQLAARSRPWLPVEQLAPTRAVQLQARDGKPLHGYLTLPLARPATPPPMVVLVHGGPYGIRDSWAFDEEVQLLATRGYAVLRVNFRGSGGFGRAFVESGYGEWGRAMQDDVADATRWAIAQGHADPQRTCIWGASYGGYAALMGAVAEPAMYRCAIAAAAPTDLNIAWKWGDIHRSRSGRHYLQTVIGRDAKDLLSRSPAHRAAEIRAAVMLVHGVRDERVAFAHARAMRKALEDAGIRYEGYFPKNEAHGINGKENRLAYYQQVLDFLDRHLGAESEPTPPALGSR